MKRLLLAVAAVAVLATAAHRILSPLDVVSHVRGLAGGTHVASAVPHHLITHVRSGLGGWTWSGFSTIDPLGPVELRTTLIGHGYTGWLEAPVDVSRSATEWTSYGLSLLDDELWYGRSVLHGGWRGFPAGYTADLGHGLLVVP